VFAFGGRGSLVDKHVFSDGLAQIQHSSRGTMLVSTADQEADDLIAAAAAKVILSFASVRITFAVLPIKTDT
jgi:hypothetical protein